MPFPFAVKQEKTGFLTVFPAHVSSSILAGLWSMTLGAFALCDWLCRLLRMPFCTHAVSPHRCRRRQGRRARFPGCRVPGEVDVALHAGGP